MALLGPVIGVCISQEVSYGIRRRLGCSEGRPARLAIAATLVLAVAVAAGLLVWAAEPITFVMLSPAMSASVGSGQPLYFTVEVRYEGLLPVTIEGIELRMAGHGPGEFKAASYLAPSGSGGIWSSPIPAMEGAGWPVRVGGGQAVNPVLSFPAVEEVKRVDQVRVRYRLLGWRSSHVEEVDYAFSQPLVAGDRLHECHAFSGPVPGFGATLGPRAAHLLVPTRSSLTSTSSVLPWTRE